MPPPRLVHLKIPALKLTRHLKIHSWKFGDLLETIIFGCYDMLVYWSVKISKNHPFLTKRCPSSSTSNCWVQHGSTCPGCTWYLLGGETTNPFETYAQVKLDRETPKHSGWTFQNMLELPWHHHLDIFSSTNLSLFFNQTPACFKASTTESISTRHCWYLWCHLETPKQVAKKRSLLDTVVDKKHTQLTLLRGY